MNRFLQKSLLAALLAGATTSYAIEPIDGVYNLGSAQDWIDFAAVVAADNSAEYNVVFTNDINLGDNQTTIKGLNGVVDGNGHTLTVAYTNAPSRTAPFATAGNVTIKNLRVTGSIASNSNCISGFIGNIINGTSPIIENCVSEVEISTTSTEDCHLGGFVGRGSDGAGLTVTNSLSKCVYTIPVSGKSIGGIVGYGGNNAAIIAKFENCLVYPTIIIDGDGEPSASTNGLSCFGNRGSITVQATDNVLVDDNSIWSTYSGSSSVAKRIKSNAAILTSGELAYTNGWGQNLSVEGDIPSPISNDKVFAVTFKGETDVVVYANATGVTSLPSAESLGVSGWVTYTVNGEPFAAGMAISEDTTVDVGVKQPGDDGFYQLATIEDWVGYASLFTASNTESYNARLVNDIDLGDNQTMINNFRGTLDGNGHTLTVNYVATDQRCAPIQNAYDAVIKNLHTVGNITTAYPQPAGIIANVNKSTVTIDGCSSAIDFMLTMTANEGVAGGLVARASDATLLTITNCLFSGSITFTGAEIKNVCSGIVGYSKNTDQTIIKNCLMTGSYVLPEGVEFDNKTASTYGINSIRRGSATLENNYARDPENRWACTSQATRLQGLQMLSGEAAYLLQNNQETLQWGQPGLNTADAVESPILTSDATARVIKLTIVDQYNGVTAYDEADGAICYANAGGALPTAYAGVTLKTADGEILTEAPTEDAIIYAYSSVSSIHEVADGAADDVSVYNLQGILVRCNVSTDNALTDLTPGLYIVNGKKYIVK